MAFRRRADVSEGTLKKAQVIRAIRKHDAVQDVGGLSNEQIDAVLKAYIDVVWISCLNNLGVRLGSLGVFKPALRKGYKGGVRKLIPRGKHEKPNKDTELVEYYIEPKPDYRTIKFYFASPASKQFRSLTEEEPNEESDV